MFASMNQYHERNTLSLMTTQFVQDRALALLHIALTGSEQTSDKDLYIVRISQMIQRVPLPVKVSISVPQRRTAGEKADSCTAVFSRCPSEDAVTFYRHDQRKVITNILTNFEHPSTLHITH